MDAPLASLAVGSHNPARDGRMKASHFEVRVALGAVGAADRSDETTQRKTSKLDTKKRTDSMHTVA